MTDKDIDTMTPQELDEAWACAIGWRLHSLSGEAHLPSPSTNWSDWGSMYEFMVEEGWWAQIWMMPEITRWAWCKGGFKGHGIAYVEEHDPDIRPAMVKAALKALRGEGKGE